MDDTNLHASTLREVRSLLSALLRGRTVTLLDREIDPADLGSALAECLDHMIAKASEPLDGSKEWHWVQACEESSYPTTRGFWKAAVDYVDRRWRLCAGDGTEAVFHEMGADVVRDDGSRRWCSTPDELRATLEAIHG